MVMPKRMSRVKIKPKLSNLRGWAKRESFYSAIAHKKKR